MAVLLDGWRRDVFQGRRSAPPTRPGWAGQGHVPGLRSISDGALWASTEEGGLSRNQRRPRRDADEQKRSALRHDPRDRTGRPSFVVGVRGLRRLSHHAARAGRVDRSAGPPCPDDGSGMQRMGQSSVRSRRAAMSPRLEGRPTASCGSSRVRAFRYSIHTNSRPTRCDHRCTSSGSRRMARCGGSTCPANGRGEPPTAAARARRADRLHGAQPRGAGKGPFQVQAGGSGSRLAGGRQRPPGAVSNLARGVPLPRDCLQQQRRVERAGRHAGVFGGPGVLPDELVSRARGCGARGPALGRLSRSYADRRAARGGDQRAKRAAHEGAGAGADPDRRRAARQRHAADHRAEPRPGHGETADRRRLGSEGDGRRRAAQADRRRDRGP